MKGMNLDASKLKMPGKSGGASSAPSGPLLPSQGVFKQKAWLPWWLIPVVIALAALAVLLYMLLPKQRRRAGRGRLQVDVRRPRRSSTDAGLKLAGVAEGEGRPEGARPAP